MDRVTLKEMIQLLALFNAHIQNTELTEDDLKWGGQCNLIHTWGSSPLRAPPPPTSSLVAVNVKMKPKTKKVAI